MTRIAAGALLAILVAAAPAYAQTNTELLRNIDDTAEGIARDMGRMLRDMNVVLDDIRDLLGEITDLLPVLDGITETLSGMSADMADISDAATRNSESLAKMEAAILGEACGPGTTAVNGVCTAEIVACDDEVVDGVCTASIRCGEGTLLHVDTCIADVSISYCGEGTVFSGGKCVAPAPPAAPAPAPAPEPEPAPTPTIVRPDETDRYVLDGDTIRIDAGTGARVYELAFADSPGLSETGGRAAVQYLDGLCGSGMITVMPESAPTGVPKALVECGGLDAAQTMVLAGHAGFDREDCQIRDFVSVRWTQERCAAAEEPKESKEPEEPVEPEPTTPAEPPTMPKQPEPVTGQLSFRDFVFPVTVGDVLRWPTADDGDPATVATISCLYEHTPVSIDAVINDNSAGVYNIDKNPTRTADDRHDTLIRLTSPVDIRLVDQKFGLGGGTHVVYDRQADIVNTGTTKDYAVSMSLADWDDIDWSDGSDPPVPADAEKAQKIFDLNLRILTDITNMHCALGGSATPGDAKAFTKLVPLSATRPSGSVLHITPYDVECSENVTITGAGAGGTADFLGGFDRIHVHDNDETVQDANVRITVDGEALTGLSFVSANFTVGSPGSGVDILGVSDPDGVSLDGVALVSMSYTATSEDACTWTERTG